MPSNPGAALVAKRWAKATAAERQAATSAATQARWANKPTVPCPQCDAPCRSIRAAAAHCPRRRRRQNAG